MAKGKSLLAERLTVFAQLTEEEQAYLDELEARPVHIKGGTEISYEGQSTQSVYIVRHGWWINKPGSESTQIRFRIR
jgi:hypothetical protein